MAFNIGDIVSVNTELTFSGEEYQVNSSGTVLNLQAVNVSTEGIPIYTYQVELYEPVTAGSGTTEQLGSTFWFTEEDLGLPAQPGTELANYADLSLAYQTGVANTSTAKNAVLGILNQVKTNSPYYDSITSLLSKLEGNEALLSSTTIAGDTQEQLAETSRTAGKLGSELGTDANLIQELAENLFAIYTIVDEAETEATEAQNQQIIQQEAAMEDDALTFNTYYTSLVEGDTSLLTPDDVGTDTQETDLSGLIEDEVTPESLTEPFDLENLD